MNLPALYARVVAKRPDLAVRSLASDISVYSEHMLDDDGPLADAILARWVEALPCGSGLMRGDRLNLWYISHTNHHADTWPVIQ